MIEYRNVRHGRVVTRHAPDEWLEASSGWERVEKTRPLDDFLAELDSEEEHGETLEALAADETDESEDA
jgi:hypothetical protein